MSNKDVVVNEFLNCMRLIISTLARKFLPSRYMTLGGRDSRITRPIGMCSGREDGI